MPIPSPFHSRTAPLCESQEWRNWSGYLAAGLYEPGHEREYYAIRNAAALIDVYSAIQIRNPRPAGGDRSEPHYDARYQPLRHRSGDVLALVR